MPSLSLRRFTRRETLAAIAPHRLLALLEVYRDFFQKRGLLLSWETDPVRIDHDRLVEILMSPDSDTPKSLLDALFYIDELSTPDGMATLLDAAVTKGLILDSDDNQTPSDVAIQVWLLAPHILERKHAELSLLKPRTFEYYQTDRTSLPAFKYPSDTQLQSLECALDDWLASKKRGRTSRVFIFEKLDSVWFMVRHGEPFKREESMEGREPSSVAYRPLKYDVLVYRCDTGELRINAKSKGEKQLYRTTIGRWLFGDENFFPCEAKYTLEPLRRNGADALYCGDISGIKTITLTEIHYLWKEDYSEIWIHKADDVFAALKERSAQIPECPRIIRATFEIVFADSKVARMVTIRPSNIAEFTRDCDGLLIEQWLERRGFTLSAREGRKLDAHVLVVN